MITGVWISPDGEGLAVQFDEDAIYVLEPGTVDLVEFGGEITDAWETLRDSAVTPTARR